MDFDGWNNGCGCRRRFRRHFNFSDCGRGFSRVGTFFRNIFMVHACVCGRRQTVSPFSQGILRHFELGFRDGRRRDIPVFCQGLARQDFKRVRFRGRLFVTSRRRREPAVSLATLAEFGPAAMAPATTTARIKGPALV